MVAPVLEAIRLTRTVADERDGARAVIDGFSFRFYQERIYTVIGPSGAGKSSLLRLLNRLDEPSGGEVQFHGKDHTQYSPCLLRSKVGYLFQTPYLFERTIRDNLLFANSSLSDVEMMRLIDETHVRVDQVDNAVEKLSVGEKQRVAIARLLATRPEVILLDEPTSALDPTHTEAIEKLIKEIADVKKLTAIVVTHSPEQAMRIGGETLLLVDGKLEESGTAEQVINRPRTEPGKLYKAKQLK